MLVRCPLSGAPLRAFALLTFQLCGVDGQLVVHGSGGVWLAAFVVAVLENEQFVNIVFDNVKS